MLPSDSVKGKRLFLCEPNVRIRNLPVEGSGYDHPGNAPKPEALPIAGEPQFRKNVNSAFIGTSLETYLRSTGIERLVVVGLTTNHCVSTTVRMAANLGFGTAIVSDATATFDRLTVDGRNRPAQEVHEAALSDLNDEFATVVETDQLVALDAVAA